MEESEIRALLEGAYALTPTLPGNYLRYDEFRTCFNLKSATPFPKCYLQEKWTFDS